MKGIVQGRKIGFFCFKRREEAVRKVGKSWGLARAQGSRKLGGFCKMPPKKWENSFSFPQEKKMHVAPNDDDAAGKIEFKDVCREKIQ